MDDSSDERFTAVANGWPSADDNWVIMISHVDVGIFYE